MKDSIIQAIIFSLIAISQFASTSFAAYESASSTLIYWTKNGKPLVLLGKDNSPTQGPVWCNFSGKKSTKDNDNPLTTAKREVWEETAHLVNLSGDPLYRYQDEGSRRVYFVWEIQYVNPEDIHKAADELGRGYNIEKTDWRWTTLEDLLNGTTGLTLHKPFREKLTHLVVGQFFKSLLNEKKYIKQTTAYTRTSVTPIYVAEKGTPYVLLSQENHDEQGRIWTNFSGGIEKIDNDNPLETAKREAFEESAHQLILSGEPLFQHQDEDSRLVYFIWLVDYIDPQLIRDSAQKLREIERETGEDFHIEKLDWQWIKLSDLLNNSIDLKLQKFFEKKLNHPIIKEEFFNLLKETKITGTKVKEDNLYEIKNKNYKNS